MRHVSIFDANIPPSVAFLRSLGRAGVPRTVYTHTAGAAAGYSRYADGLRPCPPPDATDEFVDFLAAGIERGDIDLVAPTSDPVVFAIAEAHERLGLVSPGHPSRKAVLDCLFKDRFAERMAQVGFPAPPSATPATLDEALVDADRLGYPVVLKPRSHVAIGLGTRGVVARNAEDLTEHFRPIDVDGEHSVAMRHDPGLLVPIVQKYFSYEDVDVISLSGCLAADGRVLALGHSRKMRAWPPELGIGTRFEVVPEQPFTDAAIAAVRAALGVGLFELEVVVQHAGAEIWPIDLNPRGYGQMSLEIARGNDLPMLWYEVVSGVRLAGTRPHRRPPRYWQTGVLHYTGAVVAIAGGPQRLLRLREFLGSVGEPRVGAMLDWGDLRPAIADAIGTLRHPGGLVRPFLKHRRTQKDASEAGAADTPQPGYLRRAG